jgi:hypothetical protein
MLRAKTLGIALVAVFAFSAVAVASASASMTGPHWSWNNTVRNSNTEKLPITFTGGVTKLKAGGLTIACKSASGSGNLVGGSPGTDNAKIKFEKCEVEGLGCEAKNKGGAFPNIEVNVNSELVYFTKKAGEEEKPPLGILFKTTEAKKKAFVELEFSGLCALDNGPVNAIGEEEGPGVAGIAGVVCKVVEAAETEKLTHEVECIEKEQTKFWYWKSGVLTEGKAGLEFHSSAAEQIGKGTVTAKETFSAKGA